jgi:hypothetical protein
MHRSAFIAVALLFVAGCQKSPEVTGVYLVEEAIGTKLEKTVMDFRSDGTASFKSTTQFGDGSGDAGTATLQSHGWWELDSDDVVYEAHESSMQMGSLEPFTVTNMHRLRFTIEPNGDLLRDDYPRTRLVKQR